MFKKFISLLIVLVMVSGMASVTSFAATVTDVNSDLATAVSGATAGDTLKLTADITLSSALTVNKDLTLDLNGHTVTASAKISVSGGAALTVIGGGTVKTTSDPLFEVNNGNLDLQSGSFYSNVNWGDLIRVYGSASSTANDYSVVTIGAGAVVASNGSNNGCFGIIIQESSKGSKCSYGVVANISGNLEAKGSAVYINGNVNSTSGNVPIINVYPGAVLTGVPYAAGYGIWNIRGGSFSGTEGLSVKSGEFNISGGDFSANGPFANPAAANNNGSEDTGSAISITSNSAYAQKTTMNITGGTFTSKNGYAVYEGIAKNNGSPAASATSVDTLKISGGSFSSARPEAVLLDNWASITSRGITGGTFNTPIPAFYGATGVSYSGSAPSTAVSNLQDAVNGLTVSGTPTDPEKAAVNSLVNSVTSMDAATQSEIANNPNEALRTIEDLEDLYRQCTLINKTEIESDVPGLNNDNVHVVGAALSLDPGAAHSILQLEINLRPTPSDLPSDIRNSITFDISLSSAAGAGSGWSELSLKAPLFITMPIPEGIEPKDIVIIHILKNGGYEYIYPVINTAEQTMTFGVTSLSDFIIGNFSGAPVNNTEYDRFETRKTAKTESGSFPASVHVEAAPAPSTEANPNTGLSGFAFFLALLGLCR